MATSNHIHKVAIVGAAGNIGEHMTASLLKTGTHIVTAVTRLDSQSNFPLDVLTKKVDYNDHNSLVDALRGQDALVITLSGTVPEDTEAKLIRAAADAGVSWILPNEWSPDTADEALVRDVVMFQPKVAARKLIADLGKSSFISVVTGFWYEWGLSFPAAFGIDLLHHKAVFFDEGETKVSFSTLPQVGRAVAALLSLPISSSTTSPSSASLSTFKNQVVYINSFTLTQKEMLQSALRVTETTDSDWTVTKESTVERYATGLEEIKEGKRIGFAKMMFGRVFFADGSGDFEGRRGTLNQVLGLGAGMEDVDVATGWAVERAKKRGWISR